MKFADAADAADAARRRRRRRRHTRLTSQIRENAAVRSLRCQRLLDAVRRLLPQSGAQHRRRELHAGAPPTEWDVNGAGHEVEGFATRASLLPGYTVEFKIRSLRAEALRVDVYRHGYYQGLGARLVGAAEIVNHAAMSAQPECEPISLGSVDCGNWAVVARWPVPLNATSGLYFARAVLPTRVPGRWRADASRVNYDPHHAVAGSDPTLPPDGSLPHAYGAAGKNRLRNALREPRAAHLYFVVRARLTADPPDDADGAARADVGHDGARVQWVRRPHNLRLVCVPVRARAAPRAAQPVGARPRPAPRAQALVQHAAGDARLPRGEHADARRAPRDHVARTQRVRAALRRRRRHVLAAAGGAPPPPLEGVPLGGPRRVLVVPAARGDREGEGRARRRPQLLERQRSLLGDPIRGGARRHAVPPRHDAAEREAPPADHAVRAGAGGGGGGRARADARVLQGDAVGRQARSRARCVDGHLPRRAADQPARRDAGECAVGHALRRQRAAGGLARRRRPRVRAAPRSGGTRRWARRRRRRARRRRR